MTKQEYAQYERDVSCGLNGLDFVSTGVSPACQECADSRGFDTLEDLERACEAGDVVEEGSFSWARCDCCRAEAGDRYDAHARDDNDELVHLDVCADCLQYINYGRLDDATMAEIGT